ncbi:MAG: hypothetical protein QM778_26675 [Myxococcales bacterium]
MRSIAFHPSDPATYAAVYNEAGGGLLITHDGGSSFQLACTSYVIGKRYLESVLPVVSYTPDGHLVVATFDGLFRDDGAGCNFTHATELGDRYVVGLTSDPTQPSTLYALTSSGGEQNGIYRSTDQGATWSPFGALEQAFFRTLYIVPLPGGGRRFYVSLAALEDGSVALQASIRVSEDEGASFTEYAFPQDSDMTLVGVDARDPDRIYAVAPDFTGMSARLLVNTAKGDPQAWKELGSVGSLGSFETRPEGGFFAVDLESRQLLRLNASGDGLELVDPMQITCFQTSPLTGQHFSCATFRLLEADASGVHTDKLVFDMNNLGSFVSCPGQEKALAASCQPQLDFGWCGGTHFPDAPLCQTKCVDDAGMSCVDGGTEPPKQSPKSGCAISAMPATPGLLAPGALLLWGLWRRRRRRASSACD